MDTVRVYDCLGNAAASRAHGRHWALVPGREGAYYIVDIASGKLSFVRSSVHWEGGAWYGIVVLLMYDNSIALDVGSYDIYCTHI